MIEQRLLICGDCHKAIVTTGTTGELDWLQKRVASLEAENEQLKANIAKGLAVLEAIETLSVVNIARVFGRS